MKSYQLSVPGNLLLAGEYILLEEKGLGLAVAVEPRMIVTIFPQEDWELLGQWPGGDERWVPGQPPTFAGVLFQEIFTRLTDRGDTRDRHWTTSIQPARILIDSTALFDSMGRKKGLGSSAALAVALTASLATLAHREPSDEQASLAVQAHRAAQGGRGSGYDVLTSWHGGTGLFSGGETPTWTPTDPSVLPVLSLFPGPEAVRTVGAIELYRTWKSADPEGAERLRQENNSAVKDLARATQGTHFLNSWERCREIGLELGRLIGCSAEVAAPQDFPPETFVKALGAGNETGIATGLSLKGQAPIQIAREGLRWD